MAIDYDSGSGLFDKVGKVVALTNSLETWETSTSAGNLEKEMQDLESKLDDTLDFDRQARDLLLQKWASYKNTIDGMKVRLTELTRLLMASEIITAESFDSDSASAMSDFLKFLLVRDTRKVVSNSVTGSTVQVPSSSAYLTVKSTDTNVVTDASSQAKGDVRGDTLRLRVTDALDPNNVKVSLSGTAKVGGIGHPDYENVGVVLNNYSPLRCFGDSRNMLKSGGFENLDGTGRLKDWELASGTWDTHLTVAADSLAFETNARSLRFIENGRVQQRVQASKFKPFTKYLMLVVYRKTDSGSDGTLGFGIDVTGASSTVTISIATEDVNTASAFYFNTGAQLRDFTFYIQRTLFTTGECWVTNIGMWETLNLPFGWSAIYHRPDAIIQRLTHGAHDAQVSISPANDHAGVFQTYFARYMNVLLPSYGAGAAVADALGA